MVGQKVVKERNKWQKEKAAEMKAITILCTVTVLLLLSAASVVGCQPQAAPTPPEHVPTPAPSPPASPMPAPAEIAIEESPFKNMAGKKVIIRNDDVGDATDAALQWLSNLIVSRNVKATYAVVPAWLPDHPEAINYIKNLDEKHFEMGTHGYAHVKSLEGMPYDEQYSLIKRGTELMEEYLHVRPYTFIPTRSSDDVNTTKVCQALGYHSISTSHKFPTSYVADFAMQDFSWEESWENCQVSHYSYADFKRVFDDFYFHGESRSSDQFFVVLLHHFTFRDESGQLDSTLTSDFEKSIDYMKSKDVKFMTIEEAYQWYADEPGIVVGKVNESAYFIDLTACQYDHTVSFHSPPGWGGSVLIKDFSTGEETQIHKGVFKFDGMRGHYYEIISLVRCSSLVISPDEVNSGESIEISVSVTNTGGVAGNYEVVLKINRVVEATKEGTLGAGATQKVSFRVTKDIAKPYIAYKTYVVDVNGLTGSFVVKRN